MARILVAEENNSLLRMLDAVLTAAGHEVIMAGDATRATEVAEHTNQPIDLLCTHLALAWTGGAVLAERLRERYPSMKVLLISKENPKWAALDTPGVCHNPAYCVMQKPFTVTQLVTRIEEMLRANASAAAPPGVSA